MFKSFLHGNNVRVFRCVDEFYSQPYPNSMNLSTIILSSLLLFGSCSSKRWDPNPVPEMRDDSLITRYSVSAHMVMRRIRDGESLSLIHI